MRGLLLRYGTNSYSILAPRLLPEPTKCLSAPCLSVAPIKKYNYNFFLLMGE